jgi:transglutaminase-like putative cysteine protease
MCRITSFRAVWWSVNFLFAASVVCVTFAAAREWSVRQYLHGFSDAVVSASEPPEEKIEAILHWMKAGPSRTVAADPDELSPRDPENTLNYQQLLAVCGSATNAFLNLSRSAGLQSRRLLLLTPDRNTKHVVAEVLIDGRWIVVDPSFRIVMRDNGGKTLTRRELQNPVIFEEAVAGVPNYPPGYTYERYAHVRLARLPLDGFHLRKLLESTLPGWDETLDWSLFLERESYFVLVLTAASAFFFLTLRLMLAWYADRRLQVSRFHLRQHFLRATSAFVTTPEIE